MATLIQLRRDTAANWSSNNPILSSGEIGVATDLQQFKIGNSASSWNQLEYINAIPSQYLSLANASATYLTISNASSTYIPLSASNSFDLYGSASAAEINSKSYTDTRITNLIDAAPSTLDTLNELAAALGDNANFAASTASAIGERLTIANASATYLSIVTASNTYIPFSASPNFDLAGSASAAQTAAESYADSLAPNYDPAGSASAAEFNAKAYADSLSPNYDAVGSASAAQSAAQSYADSLASNYDSAGSASAAQTAAQSYADSLSVNYDQVGSASAAEFNSKAYADSLAVNYDSAGSASAAQTAAQSYADTQISNLVDTAPSTLNTLNELAAALGDDANFAASTASAIGERLTIANASATYLRQDTASATYLRQDTASASYLPISGSVNWSNINNKPNPVITLDGDLSGSVTLTDLTSGTLTATVADDSHNHVISNIDGLQTELDSKLNSSSYTASDILTKIKTVDGSSSGLDADLLDGHDSSYFLNTSSATQEKTGTVTFHGTVNVQNLVFTGSATTINSTNLALTDSLIQLAHEQYTTDAVDIGIVGSYGDGTTSSAGHYHASFARDASQNKWKLLSNGPAPVNNVIDYTDPSVEFGTLQIGALEVTSSAVVTNLNADLLDGYNYTYFLSAATASSTYAPLSSPALTGTPAAPTAAADTNTTQVATTAFVLGQAGSATPVVNGTAAVGTSLRYARQDHVHGTDTTRAPLASPAFTGVPTAPTASANISSNQIATTEFVSNAILDGGSP